MSDGGAIILEVKAATNNGEIEVQRQWNFLVKRNHLKNVLLDTMDYSDSHSYPWQFIYCVKYLNNYSFCFAHNPIITLANLMNFLHEDG